MIQQGGSQSVGDRLARCVEEARWGEAFSFACWLAWAEPDEGKAAAAWGRTAEIAQVNLGKLVEAEQCLTRLLDLQPRDAAGLERMAQLLETKGSAEAAARSWELLAEVDTERAPACLARAAELYEKRASAPARAVACLRRLLKLQPKDVGARDRLVQLLVAQRRFQAAADLLDRPDLAGPLDRADLIAGLGTQLLDEPIEHPLAKRCFDRAVQLAPGHTAGSEGLRRLGELATGWPQAVRSLRATAVEERDRRAAASMYLRIAQLHAAYDPNGPAGVQENLQRCFLLWPGMPAALESLERLAQHWGDPGWAIRGLEALAAAARDRTVASDLWERCARIMLAEPAGRVRSVAALEKACELDPSRPAAAWLLAEVFLEEGQAGAAAEVLERHVEKLPHGSVEARLYLADLLARKLREPARAKVQLEALLRVPPETPDGVRRLAELCERLEDTELTAQVLDLLAASEPRRQRRLDWLDRLAEIHERAQRPRQALRAAAEALWLQPSQGERSERVVRIARTAGLREELLSALERAFLVAQLPAEVAAIGKALAAAVEEAPRRVAILREVLAVQPGDGEAAAALEEALLRSGSAEDLEIELRRRVAGAESPQVRLEQLRSLARLVERREASPEEQAELTGRWWPSIQRTWRLREGCGRPSSLSDGGPKRSVRSESFSLESRIPPAPPTCSRSWRPCSSRRSAKASKPWTCSARYSQPDQDALPPCACWACCWQILPPRGPRPPSPRRSTGGSAIGPRPSRFWSGGLRRRRRRSGFRSVLSRPASRKKSWSIGGERSPRSVWR